MPTRSRTARTAAARAARAGRADKAHPSRDTLVRALAAVDMGDRHAADGERARALSYYGSALDDYLAEGLLGMARTVAERMVRRYPDVVRARMTLAVLGLAEGLRILPAGEIRSTCPAFDDYVLAVRSCGQETTAVRHLRRLAEVTASEAVRERIAGFLTALGDHAGAAQVLASAAETGGADRADAPRDEQSAVWLEVLLSPVRAG